MELTPQCKEDHQNTSAPTAAEPAGAPTSIEGLVERDLAVLKALYSDLRPMTAEQRAAYRPRRQRRFIPLRQQQLAPAYAANEYHGTAPAPAPYRARLVLPEADLPDLRAAPVGAQGLGVPPPAPAGAPEGTPASLLASIADYHARQAAQP